MSDPGPVPTAPHVDLLITNGIVLTMDVERQVFNPGWVAIRDGRILACGPGSAPPFTVGEHLPAAGMLVMPGLVNAHNHLDQSLYRSCYDEEHESRELLFDLARGLTRERAFSGAALSLLEMVRYGVTTTHESHWTHFHPDSTDGVCQAVRQSGMRAIVGRGTSDLAGYTPLDFVESVEDALADLDRLERAYACDRITLSAAPSTILRCSPDALYSLCAWARDRQRVWHLHLAQNRSELAEAQRVFGMGSVEYAASLGLLGSELLAAHCSALLESELELLGEYGVRIAHCPLTLMRAGEDAPPIWRLEEQGAVVAIGTDGALTNNGQNPWEAMKAAVYLQRVRSRKPHVGSAEQALEMMTVKAAHALGIETRVGSLEPGKAADIALFRLDQPHLAPDALLVSHLVYSGTCTRAETVLVAGYPILKDGRSTVFDEEEVLARARQAQRDMIQEAGLSGELGLTRSWPVLPA